MARQWYRFDSRTGKDEAVSFPFDLAYILPEQDLELAAQVFDVFLLVTPVGEFSKNLGKRPIQVLEAPGTTRDEAVRQVGFEKAQDQIQHHVPELQDPKTRLLVPIHPREEKSSKSRSKSRKAGYITSKAVAQKIQAHAGGSEVQWAGVNPAARDTLADLKIVVHGQAQIPCHTCDNVMIKLANPAACRLGSQSCFESISFRGVQGFKDKENRGKRRTSSDKNPETPGAVDGEVTHAGV